MCRRPSVARSLLRRYDLFWWPCRLQAELPAAPQETLGTSSGRPSLTSKQRPHPSRAQREDFLGAQEAPPRSSLAPEHGTSSSCRPERTFRT